MPAPELLLVAGVSSLPSKRLLVSFRCPLRVRERLAPYLVPFRGHSRRTWVLWAIGAIVLVSIAELQPCVLIYLFDPELLAGVVAFASWLVARRVVAVTDGLATVARHLFRTLAPRYASATERLAIRIPPRVLTKWLFVQPL